MISRNLRKLRKNIDFNYLRLEAVFQKRNFAIEELIELCKKLRKYKPDYFQKIESLLEKFIRQQMVMQDAQSYYLMSLN